MTDIDFRKILLDEPFPVYQLQRGRYLCSTQLRVFARCPRTYYLQKTGAITKPNEMSAEFVLGRAAHVLVLEGPREFNRCFAVGGPVNEKTGKEYGRDTQAFEKWERIQRADKGTAVEFITSELWHTISRMTASVANHGEAQKLLNHGVAERVLRSDFRGVPVQARLDWFTEIGEIPVIVELKTCADLDFFEHDARKYQYGIQLAFYQQILLRSIFDEFGVECAVPAKVYVVAVEKKEPFRCGVFEVPDHALGHFADKIESAIESLKECQEMGEFPTRYETLRTLNIS